MKQDNTNNVTDSDVDNEEDLVVPLRQSSQPGEAKIVTCSAAISRAPISFCLYGLAERRLDSGVRWAALSSILCQYNKPFCITASVVNRFYFGDCICLFFVFVFLKTEYWGCL